MYRSYGRRCARFTFVLRHFPGDFELAFAELFERQTSEHACTGLVILESSSVVLVGDDKFPVLVEVALHDVENAVDTFKARPWVVLRDLSRSVPAFAAVRVARAAS